MYRNKVRREYNSLVAIERRATSNYEFFQTERSHRRMAKARKDRLNYLLFVESLGYDLQFSPSGLIASISR